MTLRGTDLIASHRAKLRGATLRHYIDGQFQASERDEVLHVVDPATGETLADAPAGKIADVDRAVARSLLNQLRALHPGSGITITPA